jgi:hypothetical protein
MKTKAASSRRDVIKALPALVVGAGTGAIVSPQDALAYDPGPSETGTRYRETEHVKAFYRTNGYETLKK